MISARAEPVGSLLRPEYLLAARGRRAQGELTAAGFKRVEDRAVDEAVAVQEGAGLPVVTDGEMRRTSFQSRMTAAVEGMPDPDLDAFLWGEWHGEDGETRRISRPEGLGVTGRLRRRRALSAEEFVYLRGRTDRIPKVTLPAPLLWVNFWSPRESADVYPTAEDYLEDVVRVLREEVGELAALGCRYVQLDAPHYPLLRDEAAARPFERLGRTREEWLELSVEAENRVMEGFPEVTFALHMCRGNQDSRWLVSGDYAPLAERVFPRTRADRLLLEYDDARAGGFGPLEAVPEETVLVLGLVSTKRPAREPPDELARRVEEASSHVPLDRLAVSPQCGFASSVVGNRISAEAQAGKLRTVVETAERIWGGVA